jgi:hypothetical protein
MEERWSGGVDKFQISIIIMIIIINKEEKLKRASK